MSEKKNCAFWNGKKGYYVLEFSREDGRVRVNAVGPIPQGGFAWVSNVASALAASEGEAYQAMIERLIEVGA